MVPQSPLYKRRIFELQTSMVYTNVNWSTNWSGSITVPGCWCWKSEKMCHVIGLTGWKMATNQTNTTTTMLTAAVFNDHDYVASTIFNYEENIELLLDILEEEK